MKSVIELFCKNWSAEPFSIGLREEKPKTLKGMSFEGLENLRVHLEDSKGLALKLEEVDLHRNEWREKLRPCLLSPQRKR
ncbi:hypothetical protein TB2_005516 [Malus domestica]